MKENINIDSMTSMYRQENCEFKRQGSNDTVDCKIRGLRRPVNQAPQTAHNEEDSDPNISRVTIDGCDYEVEEDEILQWLKLIFLLCWGLILSCFVSQDTIA